MGTNQVNFTQNVKDLANLNGNKDEQLDFSAVHIMNNERRHIVVWVHKELNVKIR